MGKKKGGKMFAPKDLVRGLVCKNVHFLKSMEARCLDTIWVAGVVQYNPQGCFAKFYGLGCWGWAVMGRNPAKIGLGRLGLCHYFIDLAGFPAKSGVKGGQKPELHPRPPDLHQNVGNII